MDQLDQSQVFSAQTDGVMALSVQAKEHEILGHLVQELLRGGKTLNRKSLCIALLARLDNCEDLLMKQHYENIFSLLLGR